MSFRTGASILLAACFFVVLTYGKPQQQRQMIVEKCMKENKLDKAMLEKFNKTKPSEPAENVKCYVKCILTESKLMNSKGDLTLPKLENKATAEAIQPCKTVTGKDNCDKAFKFHRCLNEAINGNRTEST